MILARIGKARWCSRCGNSWVHHQTCPTFDNQTQRLEAKCYRAVWITKKLAKKIRA